MEISVKQEQGFSVVAVSDRLDTMTVWEFEQKGRHLRWSEDSDTDQGAAPDQADQR